MQLYSFTVSPYEENSYLLIADTKEAWVIDPGFYTEHEKKTLEDVLLQEKATLTGIYLTHAHIDHILGVAWLVQKYAIPLFYHASEEVVYQHAAEWASWMGLRYSQGPKPQRYLTEGEVLYLGGERVEILHVPGHSPGHVAYYFPFRRWLFAGDVLFQGSIGNYTLPLANYDMLMDSIFKKILPLGDDVKVWPGHGQATTIGAERRLNPFLQPE
ncbi:MAG: MBL fold metallo-hydrolase [Bacteroidia bacterium]|nr:MBL fold metallo-hydrolase [Bacteroidia bacterium]